MTLEEPFEAGAGIEQALLVEGGFGKTFVKQEGACDPAVVAEEIIGFLLDALVGLRVIEELAHKAFDIVFLLIEPSLEIMGKLGELKAVIVGLLGLIDEMPCIGSLVIVLLDGGSGAALFVAKLEEIDHQRQGQELKQEGSEVKAGICIGRGFGRDLHSADTRGERGRCIGGSVVVMVVVVLVCGCRRLLCGQRGAGQGGCGGNSCGRGRCGCNGGAWAGGRCEICTERSGCIALALGLFGATVAQAGDRDFETFLATKSLW